MKNIINKLKTILFLSLIITATGFIIWFIIYLKEFMLGNINKLRGSLVFTVFSAMIILLIAFLIVSKKISRKDKSEKDLEGEKI